MAESVQNNNKGNKELARHNPQNTKAKLTVTLKYPDVLGLLLDGKAGFSCEEGKG